MNTSLPPEDLACPHPAACPVAVEQLTRLAETDRLGRITIPEDSMWFRVYHAADGYHQPNSGFGDTRFAPFDATGSGQRVPTLYLAESLAAALLETAFHDVAAQQPRVVAESSLRGKLHAALHSPTALELVDLRDDALHNVDLPRTAVSSSPPEHYPCTRRVAQAIHAMASAPQGILWHSRQAELNDAPPAQVAVVFADRLPRERGSWQLAAHLHASGSLVDGFGRQLLDELAEELGITVLTRREV